MFSSNLSNYSEGVDRTFIIILSIILFFLVSLTITLVVFIVKYRRSKSPVAAQIHGNTKLEILWTSIPLVIVMAMFYFGWTNWKPMESKPPKDAFQIRTIARMWKWDFQYPNGNRIDSLIIPAGRPVALNMESVDVIHSLYIPAFRIKKDVVPGKPRVAWFIANSPGTYDLFCAEYCGLLHAAMITTVNVLPQEEFDKWYSDTTVAAAAITGGAEAEAPAMKGRELVRQMGCNACHSADGSTIVGPTFKGLFGHEVTVIEGGSEKTVPADEEYLRRSITDPNIEVVKGFSRGLMQSYKGQLSDEEIDQIIEYIKTVQ